MKKTTLLLILPILVSCSFKYSYEVSPYEVFGVIDSNMNYISPLNSFVKLQMYNQEELNEIKSEFNNRIKTTHMNVDSYHKYNLVNNIKTVNENYNNGPIKVSDELIDITNITNDPDFNELQDALTSVIDYQNIDQYIVIDENNLTIELKPLENSRVPVSLNFGGISKGFALDRVNNLFLNNQPAIISAGSSSISLKGKFPLSNRDYYLVNLKEPALYKESQTEVFCQLKLGEYTNISNSGDYEKFFISVDTGEFRSHIINPKTGYSDNFHRSAVVWSNTHSYVLDVLSTTLMNIETFEDIKKMVEDFETFYQSEIAYCIIDDYDNGYNLSVNQKFYNSINFNKISSTIKNVNIV